MTTNNGLKNQARFSGFLFLLWILAGFYEMYFVSPKIFINDDTATSMQNIVSHEVLYRSGIFSGIIANALWVLLAWMFYRIFKSVNENYSQLLISFVLVQVPVTFINGALGISVISLSKGELLETFGQIQQQDIGMLLVKISNFTTITIELFWGLWLMPLAVLVYKSRFIPKVIGVWLAINSLVYVILCFVSIVFPQFKSAVFWYGMPAMFGELALMLWLLIIGIRVRESSAA